MKWIAMIAFFFLFACSPPQRLWTGYDITCYSGERIIFEASGYRLDGSYGVFNEQPSLDAPIIIHPTNAVCTWKRVGQA